MDFLTFGICVKTAFMKLRLTLVLFCLLGIGAFSHAQTKKKEPKPMVEEGADAIPVTVRSTKHRKSPPPPPKMERVRFAPPKIVKDGKMAPPPPPEPPAKAEIQFDKDGKQLPPPPPPPKVEKVRFAPPKIVKDAPAHSTKEKPVKPDAPPAADFKG